MSKKFSYSFIVNPKTGRKVLTHGKLGKSIINGFVSNLNGGKQLGGGVQFDLLATAKRTGVGMWKAVNVKNDDAWEQNFKTQVTTKWEEILKNIEFLNDANKRWKLSVAQKKADVDNTDRQKDAGVSTGYELFDDNAAYTEIRTERLDYNRKKRQSEEEKKKEDKHKAQDLVTMKSLLAEGTPGTRAEKTEEVVDPDTEDASFVYGTGL